MAIRKISILLVIFVVLLVGLTANSCTVYRKYSFHHSLGNFSIYIPLSFGPVFVEDVSEDYVSLFASTIFSGDLYFSSSVSKISPSFPDCKTLLENNLSWAKQGQADDEFSLIERSSISIDGLDGEKIVYQYFVHYESEIIDNKIVIPKPTKYISYEAYFKKNDALWYLNVGSVFEKDKEAKAIFQRILDSFRFK